jgi:hypothetical protein
VDPHAAEAVLCGSRHFKRNWGKDPARGRATVDAAVALLELPSCFHPRKPQPCWVSLGGNILIPFLLSLHRKCATSDGAGRRIRCSGRPPYPCRPPDRRVVQSLARLALRGRTPRVAPCLWPRRLSFRHEAVRPSQQQGDEGPRRLGGGWLLLRHLSARRHPTFRSPRALTRLVPPSDLSCARRVLIDDPSTLLQALELRELLQV